MLAAQGEELIEWRVESSAGIGAVPLEAKRSIGVAENECIIADFDRFIVDGKSFFEPSGSATFFGKDMKHLMGEFMEEDR